MAEEQKLPETASKKEVLYKWKSPSRLFKKRNKEYYYNILAIVGLIVVILIVAREYVFILAVFSIVFFIYATSVVAPEDVEHKITNLGIDSAGHYYRWEELFEFWFEEQWEQPFIVIRSMQGSRILMLLSKENKEKVKELISKHIPFREKPQNTWVDNAANWLTEKIPLDKPAS